MGQKTTNSWQSLIGRPERFPGSTPVQRDERSLIHAEKHAKLSGEVLPVSKEPLFASAKEICGRSGNFNTNRTGFNDPRSPIMHGSDCEK